MLLEAYERDWLALAYPLLFRAAVLDSLSLGSSLAARAVDIPTIKSKKS